jgi:hypothetical protein
MVETRRQPLERQLPVAVLGPRVLRGGDHARAQAGHHAGALRLVEGVGGRDIEDRLDAGGGHVGVLAARPRGAAGAQLDLRKGDGHPVANG